MDSARAQWYVIQCKPRQDERALENLERQSFECFRPTRRIERIRSGRKLELIEPLFPGYLFVHLDRVSDNWLPIRSTRGVSRIVRFEEYPMPVADELIEGIRERMASGPIKEAYLQPGERVMITEGSFSQVEAIFLCNEGDERVVLLMNILNREQKLRFPISSVRRI